MFAIVKDHTSTVLEQGPIMNEYCVPYRVVDRFVKEVGDHLSFAGAIQEIEV